MNGKLNEKKQIVLYVVMALMLIFLLINIVYAVIQYHDVGVSDFTRRYRESRYMMAGVSPFDVIYGAHPVIDAIGELPRNSGYPSWAMVIGIITNFAFLPERIAEILTFFLMIASIALAAALLYQFGKRMKWHREHCVLLTLAGLCISGFWTGLPYLNFGLVAGVLLLGFVLLEKEHPLWAGILLGIASVKPVLAAPFFLAVLLRRNWKCFVVASAIPLIALIIGWILTDISPFTMLSQMNAEGNTYWNNAFFSGWNWMLQGGYSTKVCNTMSMIFVIATALLMWLWLYPSEDRLVWYAIPAVISGFWTYSQEHDRTVQLILLLALAVYIMKEKRLSKWMMLCIFACVVYRRYLVMISEALGLHIAYQTFDMIYDLILIAALIVLIVRARKEQEIERISHEANA